MLTTDVEQFLAEGSPLGHPGTMLATLCFDPGAGEYHTNVLLAAGDSHRCMIAKVF